MIQKLIQGENSEVLKALIPHYRGKVKCIYIDPPYNNGDKYTHYDDSTHSQWIDMMKERLLLLKETLTENGSIWISIDDGEMHYLKVMADQVFGRQNFITTIIWQQRTTRENRKLFSNNHEYILVYSKNKNRFKESLNKLPPTNEVLSRYKNPDNDSRGPWQSISMNVQAGHAVESQFFEITAPNGNSHSPPNGRCWAYNKNKINAFIEDNRVWFGKDGHGVPRLKKFLSESNPKLTPETLWLASEVGTNLEAKKQLLSLFPDKSVFETPKPERLIKRVFELCTIKGDLILDCYAGSGTSLVVAHKLGLQFIGIDQGDQLKDVALPRVELSTQESEIFSNNVSVEYTKIDSSQGADGSNDLFRSSEAA